LENKCAMLRVKKWLYCQSLIPTIGPYIISDLAKVIC